MDSNRTDFKETKERTDHSSKTTTVIYHPTVARDKFFDAVIDRPIFLFILRGALETFNEWSSMLKSSSKSTS